MASKAARIALGSAAALEFAAGLWRSHERSSMFDAAQARSAAISRPLVVIGDPDAGAWTGLLGRAYGCGALCLDINGCPLCPAQLPADITRGPIVRVADNSSVVFCSCVLEYVNDPQAAWNEILRMAGSYQNVFLVTVQTWTATAAMYPGAKWMVDYNPSTGEIRFLPVTATRTVAYAATLAGLTAASIW